MEISSESPAEPERLHRERAHPSLPRRDELYRRIVEESRVGVLAFDADGKVVYANSRAGDLLGYEPDDLLGKTARDLFLDFDLQPHADGLPEGEYRTTRHGPIAWLQVSASPVLENDRFAGSYCFLTDATERKVNEEKIARQLADLRALREIEASISSSFGMETNLGLLVSHAVKELRVDAASILLLDPLANVLINASATGFRTSAFGRGAIVPINQSYAGQALLGRRTVSIADLSRGHESDPFAADFRRESFVTYYGVPLISRGVACGVLQVFHRSRLQPDEEWLSFLQALAAQAAIAIDNATVLETLEHGHQELAIAYDATIEGWSQAMDLRDKETEGHTQRVVTMTIQLAQAFGMSIEEVQQVRRGALLHDIGKMGVPDAILFKPGPLSEDEWLSMKRHPELAYKMLSPIRYLQRALNIPYCHHEKWDGTGYPRGLKGEEIPLEARLFAVVDVWDSLTSDRPYRAAWSREKALEYISSQAGSHFDPHVVAKFMDLVRAQSASGTGTE